MERILRIIPATIIMMITTRIKFLIALFALSFNPLYALPPFGSECREYFETCMKKLEEEARSRTISMDQENASRFIKKKLPKPPSSLDKADQELLDFLFKVYLCARPQVGEDKLRAKSFEEAAFEEGFLRCFELEPIDVQPVAEHVYNALIEHCADTTFFTFVAGIQQGIRCAALYTGKEEVRIQYLEESLLAPFTGDKALNPTLLANLKLALEKILQKRPIDLLTIKNLSRDIASLEKQALSKARSSTAATHATTDSRRAASSESPAAKTSSRLSAACGAGSGDAAASSSYPEARLSASPAATKAQRKWLKGFMHALENSKETPAALINDAFSNALVFLAKLFPHAPGDRLEETLNEYTFSNAAFEQGFLRAIHNYACINNIEKQATLLYEVIGSDNTTPSLSQFLAGLYEGIAAVDAAEKNGIPHTLKIQPGWLKWSLSYEYQSSNIPDPDFDPGKTLFIIFINSTGISTTGIPLPRFKIISRENAPLEERKERCLQRLDDAISQLSKTKKIPQGKELSTLPNGGAGSGHAAASSSYSELPESSSSPEERIHRDRWLKELVTACGKIVTAREKVTLPISSSLGLSGSEKDLRDMTVKILDTFAGQYFKCPSRYRDIFGSHTFTETAFFFGFFGGSETKDLDPSVLGEIDTLYNALAVEHNASPIFHFIVGVIEGCAYISAPTRATRCLPTPSDADLASSFITLADAYSLDSFDTTNLRSVCTLDEDGNVSISLGKLRSNFHLLMCEYSKIRRRGGQTLVEGRSQTYSQEYFNNLTAGPLNAFLDVLQGTSKPTILHDDVAQKAFLAHEALKLSPDELSPEIRKIFEAYKREYVQFPTFSTGFVAGFLGTASRAETANSLYAGIVESHPYHPVTQFLQGILFGYAYKTAADSLGKKLEISADRLDISAIEKAYNEGLRLYQDKIGEAIPILLSGTDVLADCTKETCYLSIVEIARLAGTHTAYLSDPKRQSKDLGRFNVLSEKTLKTQREHAEYVIGLNLQRLEAASGAASRPRAGSNASGEYDAFPAEEKALLHAAAEKYKTRGGLPYELQSALMSPPTATTRASISTPPKPNPYAGKTPRQRELLEKLEKRNASTSNRELSDFLFRLNNILQNGQKLTTINNRDHDQREIHLALAELSLSVPEHEKHLRKQAYLIFTRGLLVGFSEDTNIDTAQYVGSVKPNGSTYKAAKILCEKAPTHDTTYFMHGVLEACRIRKACRELGYVPILDVKALEPVEMEKNFQAGKEDAGLFDKHIQKVITRMDEGTITFNPLTISICAGANLGVRPLPTETQLQNIWSTCIKVTLDPREKTSTTEETPGVSDAAARKKKKKKKKGTRASGAPQEAAADMGCAGAGGEAPEAPATPGPLEGDAAAADLDSNETVDKAPQASAAPVLFNGGPLETAKASLDEARDASVDATHATGEIQTSDILSPTSEPMTESKRAKGRAKTPAELIRKARKEANRAKRAATRETKTPPEAASQEAEAQPVQRADAAIEAAGSTPASLPPQTAPAPQTQAASQDVTTAAQHTTEVPVVVLASDAPQTAPQGIRKTLSNVTKQDAISMHSALAAAQKKRASQAAQDTFLAQFINKEARDAATPALAPKEAASATPAPAASAQAVAPQALPAAHVSPLPAPSFPPAAYSTPRMGAMPAYPQVFRMPPTDAIPRGPWGGAGAPGFPRAPYPSYGAPTLAPTMQAPAPFPPQAYAPPYGMYPAPAAHPYGMPMHAPAPYPPQAYAPPYGLYSAPAPHADYHPAVYAEPMAPEPRSTPGLTDEEKKELSDLTSLKETHLSLSAWQTINELLEKVPHEHRARASVEKYHYFLHTSAGFLEGYKHYADASTNKETYCSALQKEIDALKAKHASLIPLAIQGKIDRLNGQIKGFRAAQNIAKPA